MKIHNPSEKPQSGYMLLESLLAVLVFSIGVLGVISLYAVSVKNAGGAKYRTDASFLANELIGQMWVANRATTALQTDFQGGNGTDGTRYTAWLAHVQALLPGVSSSVVPPTVPRVAVADTSSGNSRRSTVTITILWQLPGEATPHQYATVASINE